MNNVTLSSDSHPLTKTKTITVAEGLDRTHSAMQRVFDATRLYIEQLKNGERVQLRHLQEKVSVFLGLPHFMIAPFVSAFVETYPGCTVQKGRGGGVYRGPQAAKPGCERCNGCGQKIRKKKTVSSSVQDQAA